MITRSQLKRVGADHAADHLERLGFSVVYRDVQLRFREIDLVARDDARIIFCEVTARRYASAVPPMTRRWPPAPEHRRAARAWLRENPSCEPPVLAKLRFDSVEVTVDTFGRLILLEHRYVEYPATEPTGGER